MYAVCAQCRLSVKIDNKPLLVIRNLFLGKGEGGGVKFRLSKSYLWNNIQ